MNSGQVYDAGEREMEAMERSHRRRIDRMQQRINGLSELVDELTVQRDGLLAACR